jgi:hypothetical protein
MESGGMMARIKVQKSIKIIQQSTRAGGGNGRQWDGDNGTLTAAQSTAAFDGGNGQRQQ